MAGKRVGISRRGKFEPGTKIRQKAANFEPGTDLRRTHGSGFSRESAHEAKPSFSGGFLSRYIRESWTVDVTSGSISAVSFGIAQLRTNSARTRH